MVDGVQVALPSYEEAVYGSSGHCVPPADPRVQIVLSEGSGPSGRTGPREQQLQDQGACSSAGGEEEAPGQSGLCEAWASQGSETVMVHQATTSSWVAGSGNSRVAYKEAPDSENSDIQSLLSLTSEDYTDGRWSALIVNYEPLRGHAGSEEGLGASLIIGYLEAEENNTWGISLQNKVLPSAPGRALDST